MEQLSLEAFAHELTEHLICELGGESSVTFDAENEEDNPLGPQIEITTPDIPVPIHICMRDCYASYERGEPIDRICKKTLSFIEEVIASEQMILDPLDDPDVTKSMITGQVLNAEWYAPVLEDRPHQRLLDLAVIYAAVQGDYPADYVELQLDEGLMQALEIRDEKELERLVEKNMRKLDPPIFQSMRSLLEEAMGIPFPQEGPDRLYVLSSKSRAYGAYWITVPQMRRQIANEVGGDYYVLPSSIHDCLILPTTMEQSAEELQAIVKEVNRTQVDPEDVLSDHIYKYISKSDELIIFA